MKGCPLTIPVSNVNKKHSLSGHQPSHKQLKLAGDGKEKHLFFFLAELRIDIEQQKSILILDGNDGASF